MAHLPSQGMSRHTPSLYYQASKLLSVGHVPVGFKKAVVTPLIKKASLPVDDFKNYRPVSGLSFKACGMCGGKTAL